MLLVGQTGLGSEDAMDRMGIHPLSKKGENQYASPEAQARRVMARYQASLVK